MPFRSQVLVTPEGRKRTEEEIRRRSAELASVNDVKALAAYFRGGVQGLYTTTSEIAAIRTPVLAVIGSFDPGLPNVKRLETVLPAIKLVVIDGATHIGDRGAPMRPEFVAAIRTFIDSHRASR